MNAGAGDSMEEADQLSLTFAALADPTRRAILARLASGELTVNEIARPFAMSVQAVSKHLKVLERAGLIKRGREAQWRPSRLDPAPLNAASSWIQQYRELAADRMDRLDTEIKKLQSRTKESQDGQV
ncbi:MAG TPA: metalloregulator ArsR/SmtB family transcription factor [Candidatus Limnocylindrales bacterium]